MPPHSIGTGTISFGLVSIPIKLYPATSPAGVSFNMLHAKCGSRLRQQMLCPVCNEVVDRSQTVRGYEVAKDQYVRVADEELKALEGEASKTIDIAESTSSARTTWGPTRAARSPIACSRTPWRTPARWRSPSSSCAARRRWCCSVPHRAA